VSLASAAARYETELHHAGGAGVRYDENGNGNSVLFTAVQARTSCSLRLRQNGPGTHAEVDCALDSNDPASVALRAAAQPLVLPPGVHRIEYKLDGSARIAGVTYRNASGGTEQMDVAVPAGTTFFAASVSFVYFSAQNKTASGDVHVMVLVDGRILQQATSSTAYGIATASGSVPR